MDSWQDEQEAYRLQKLRDGEETAMLLGIIALALCLVVVVSLVSERWVTPWLMR